MGVMLLLLLLPPWLMLGEVLHFLVGLYRLGGDLGMRVVPWTCRPWWEEVGCVCVIKWL